MKLLVMGMSRVVLPLILVVCCGQVVLASEKIPGLDQLGVSYKATKLEFIATGEGAELRHKTDNYTLDVKLDSLSKQQYDQLLVLLDTSSATAPKYKENSSYSLVDFLSPFMQALNGYQFNPMEEEFSWPIKKIVDAYDKEDSVELQSLWEHAESKTPLTTLINCWTTVHEFFRSRLNPEETVIDIAWIGRPSASHILTDEYVTPVGEENLQFGDIVLFSDYDDGYGDQLVQHAAIYVLPGLYFEKTDSGFNDAFRMVLEKDLLSKLAKFLSDKSKRKYYRLKKGINIPRLSESMALIGEKGFYGEFFSEKDLKTMAIEVDWVPGSFGGVSKPEDYVYRLHSINYKNGKLDKSSPIFKQFLTPKYKKSQ